MDQTPTFGTIFNRKKNVRFSEFCTNTTNPKKIKKREEEKNSSKYHSDGIKVKKSKSKKRKLSTHKKSRKLSENNKVVPNISANNDEINTHKLPKKYKSLEENLSSFIKNHKFLLRDDFNENKVNQFLSSKETAFEMPLISF